MLAAAPSVLASHPTLAAKIRAVPIYVVILVIFGALSWPGTVIGGPLYAATQFAVRASGVVLRALGPTNRLESYLVAMGVVLFIIGNALQFLSTY
jgi:hypothetical protein